MTHFLCVFCGHEVSSHGGTGSDAACCGKVGHVTKVLTELVYPPIPIREHDWCAKLDDYDGAPDAGYQPVGYGMTEEAAIEDLQTCLEKRDV